MPKKEQCRANPFYPIIRIMPQQRAGVHILVRYKKKYQHFFLQFITCANTNTLRLNEQDLLLYYANHPQA